jgi:LysR family transcriptional regulator, low CO2-responsive transcriptional regulator
MPPPPPPDREWSAAPSWRRLLAQSNKYFGGRLSDRSCIVARVTPARLRTFLAVVDGGSARTAAERLHVTESAVSASVAALTREVGVPLVERHGRRLAPTSAGFVFADYARRILGLSEEAVDATRQDSDPEHGRLRLAAVTTAGEYLLPAALAGFRRHHPDARFSVEIGPRDQMLRRISEHAVDVVIAGRPPVGSGLRTRAWRANALVVVGAFGSDADVAGATWLLREPGSGTREAALGWLRARDLDPPTLTLGSHGAVVASAVLGLGVTMVSLDAVADLIAADQLSRIPAAGTPLVRPWHALTRPAPTPITRLFLAHLTTPELAGPVSFQRGAPSRGRG